MIYLQKEMQEINDYYSVLLDKNILQIIVSFYKKITSNAADQGNSNII